MATHPYTSGPNSIAQMINQLRKSFPAIVNSDTVKKYQIAPKNESYVINVLQFLGITDPDGKKTQKSSEVFSKHDDVEFQTGFGEIVKSAYSELFDLHGDAAWNLERGKLIGYFRQADQTSEVIGTRQASVFSVLAALSGKAPDGATSSRPTPKPNTGSKPRVSANQSNSNATRKPPTTKDTQTIDVGKNGGGASGVTLNVRIEVNLPAGGDAQTYDAIFSSIRKNLMNG